MKKRLLGALAFVSALSVAVPAMADATLAKIKDSGTIKLGYRENSPPFSFQGNDGKPHGYSVDLCRIVADEVARQLGIAKLDVR